jgi:hypothetical protein
MQPKGFLLTNDSTMPLAATLTALNGSAFEFFAEHFLLEKLNLSNHFLKRILLDGFLKRNDSARGVKISDWNTVRRCRR